MKLELNADIIYCSASIFINSVIDKKNNDCVWVELRSYLKEVQGCQNGLNSFKNHYHPNQFRQVCYNNLNYNANLKPRRN